MVPDSQFDFAMLVKERMEEEEQLAELNMYNPFNSHSPLSTPPSSPELVPTDDFNEPSVELTCIPPLQSGSDPLAMSQLGS